MPGNTPFKIDLGCIVEDTVTRFKGVITARSQNLTGCNTYFIAPGVQKDGKLGEGYWFDEQRIKVLAIPRKEVSGPFPG